MPRAQDAVLDARKSAAASIDVYYEANLLTGEASQPSLDELTKKALKIKEDGDRLFVHWTSPAAAVECQAIGPVRTCLGPGVGFSLHSNSVCMHIPKTVVYPGCRMHFSACSYSHVRRASHALDFAGNALLLRPLVVVARVVRDRQQKVPLPRRRLPLLVLRLRPWQRSDSHQVQLQARTRGAPHVRRPASAVLAPGLRLQRLQLNLALRLMR